MEELLQIAPWVHAGLGGVCLFSGVLALTAKKAKGRHPAAGRVFGASLALTFAAILINIVVAENVFMLGLGWLALYAGAEGWRALLRSQGRLGPHPTTADYLLAGVTLLLSVGLAVFGLFVFIRTSNVMGLVCVGFGLLAASLVRATRRRWNAPPSKPEWLAVHIHMMLGAFSAAVTAFLAIQLSGRIGGFEWVVWVAPTVLLSRYGTREARRRGLERAP